MKHKIGYVDGFVMVVPKKNVAAYRRMATDGKRLWMKYGALDYKECIGDDLSPKWVILTFPKMTKTKKSETVFFSYIGYKNRAHRDAVNKKVMSDPSMQDPEKMKKAMPFDMKKMAMGGFKVLVG